MSYVRHGYFGKAAVECFLPILGIMAGCGPYGEPDDVLPSSETPGFGDEETPVQAETTPTLHPGLETLSYETLLEGETEDGDLTCSETPDECCRTLHVSLCGSSSELQTTFDSVLPTVEPPLIDFGVHVALLSYTTMCPGGNKHLKVDEIVADGLDLQILALVRLRSS